jgi:hypothetical protein
MADIPELEEAQKHASQSKFNKEELDSKLTQLKVAKDEGFTSKNSFKSSV